MNDPVRIHMRVPGTAPMTELMTSIQSVEAAGFDGAGILDSQMLCRDTFVTLGQAATRTSRLTLFPAVTNPFTRHASVLAGAIETVAELAPGRVKFVIGTGYTSASTIGRKPATLAEMRACIATVKALLAGHSVDFDGTPGRLAYAAGRRIPVLMAASGPKAIELAGEIADGVLLLVGFNQGIVETALGYLERGARRAGRRVEDLEVIWAARTGTAATAAEARRMARPDRRPLGHPPLGRPLARPRRAPPPEVRHPRRGREGLSRSLARPRLGGGHRGDVVRARRDHRPALRRPRSRRDRRGLRPAHRGDVQARRAQPLPHALPDLRPARAGGARLPRRGLPRTFTPPASAEPGRTRRMRILTTLPQRLQRSSAASAAPWTRSRCRAATECGRTSRPT